SMPLLYVHRGTAVFNIAVTTNSARPLVQAVLCNKAVASNGLANHSIYRMARLSRLYAPDTPQLIQVRFARPLAPLHEPAPSDKLDLLAGWLRDAAREEKVPVHGWTLLNDRLALLATPPTQAGTARLIQTVGRRFATRIQKGRVFAERYRSALLQPEAWVLYGLIWLELQPAQHGYVDDALRWPWSSA